MLSPLVVMKLLLPPTTGTRSDIPKAEPRNLAAVVVPVIADPLQASQRRVPRTVPKNKALVILVGVASDPLELLSVAAKLQNLPNPTS